MILSESRFLTDENIHPDVVAYMISKGFDVTTVKEHGSRYCWPITLLKRHPTAWMRFGKKGAGRLKPWKLEARTYEKIGFPPVNVISIADFLQIIREIS